ALRSPHRWPSRSQALLGKSSRPVSPRVWRRRARGGGLDHQRAKCRPDPALRADRRLPECPRGTPRHRAATALRPTWRHPWRRTCRRTNPRRHHCPTQPSPTHPCDAPKAVMPNLNSISPPNYLTLVATNPDTTHLKAVAQHEDGSTRLVLDGKPT